MKKITKWAGLVSATFLIVGCQNTDESGSETVDTEPVEEGQEDENIDEENESEGMEVANGDNEGAEEVASSDGDENDLDEYERIEETPHYFIQTDFIDADAEFITNFSIKRDGEQDLSNEERLEQSLIDSDPSEQDILGSFTEVSVEWPTLQVQFSVDDNQIAATSAQSSLFYSSLSGISDLYGIEEIVFLSPDGEREITVAERIVDEPIIIEEERGLTRGYYTLYDEESEETLFIAGGDVEEQVTNESEGPLTFQETVEVMQTIDHEDAFYASAIVDGIDIGEATLEDGIATVEYTMDEEVVTDSDHVVFGHAMQLTALDFHVTYPLIK